MSLHRRSFSNGCAGSPVTGETMDKPQPSLVPISYLMRVGELRPTRCVGKENRKSYPIPLPGAEGLRIGFLHYVTGEHERSWFISAPSYLSFWNVESGKLAELRAFSPAEIGLAAPEGEWLGTHAAPEERERPEFISKRDGLLRSYDLLLAPFAAGMTEISREVRTAAREFQLLSREIWETPLLPYYEHLGQRFFGWVRNVSA